MGFKHLLKIVTTILASSVRIKYKAQHTALFVILENGPRVVDEYFYTFLDEDGEEVIVNLVEIICVVGPTYIFDEGFKMYFEELDES